jgi:hypothetical protein
MLKRANLGQNDTLSGFLGQKAGFGGQSYPVILPLSVFLKEAAADRKSPAQIIGELVRKEIAAAV